MAISWPQTGYHNKTLETFDEAMYEYAITEGPRKGPVDPPDGLGWQELDWVRDDFIDVALWRRLK